MTKRNKTPKTSALVKPDEYGLVQIEHAKNELSEIVSELGSVIAKLDVFNKVLEKKLDGVRTPYEEINALRTILKTTKSQQLDIEDKYIQLRRYLAELPKRL